MFFVHSHLARFTICWTVMQIAQRAQLQKFNLTNPMLRVLLVVLAKDDGTLIHEVCLCSLMVCFPLHYACEQRNTPTV